MNVPSYPSGLSLSSGEDEEESYLSSSDRFAPHQHLESSSELPANTLTNNSKKSLSDKNIIKNDENHNNITKPQQQNWFQSKIITPFVNIFQNKTNNTTTLNNQFITNPVHSTTSVNNMAEDSEEEEFFFQATTTETNSSRHKRTLSSTKTSTVFSNTVEETSEENKRLSDSKLLYQNISTLNESEANYNAYCQFLNSQDKLLQQLRATRRWRWSCCFLFSISFLFLIVFCYTSIYFVFFRLPFFYLDNIQIIKMPLKDRILGFQIQIQCYNPSISVVKLDGLVLLPTIVDLIKMEFYQLSDSILMPKNQTFYCYQNRLYGENMAQIQSYMSLKDNPNYPEIINLLFRNTYALKMDGTISYSIGVLSYSVKVSRLQNLYL